ncbi:MAG: LysM peptidoglycan-binding domain-containing protein [Rikenellaceae bacterium]
MDKKNTSHINKLLLTLSLVFLFFATTSVDASEVTKTKKVKGCLTHVLNHGEDLPSLIRRYEIALEDIKEYNPIIDKELEVGQLVYIPRKKVGKASPEKIAADIKMLSDLATPQEEATEDKVHDEVEELEGTNTLQDTLRIHKHTVKEGETFYSISRLYGVSVENIQVFNPMVSRNEISTGTTLNIPIKNILVEEEIGESKESAGLAHLEFKAHNSKAIKVTLILPLKSDNVQSVQFTDFYQGFLAGLDSLKNEGVSVAMNVINLERNSAKIDDIITSPALLESDIIFGPVYAEQFARVAETVSHKNIPIVSPLGAVNSEGKNVFQVSPNPLTKYDKLREHLDSKHLVLLSTKNDDSEFLDKIREFAPNQIITLPFDIKREAEGYAKDLPTDKPSIYLVATTDATQADAIVSKIGAIKDFGLGRDITTIATSRIARFTNINPALLFDADVSYTTSYHADRTDKLVLEFDNRYMTLFGKLPTLYSYRGYDVAMFFLGSMKEFGSDFNDYIVDYFTTILQVTYKFTTDGSHSKLENSEWMLVRYRPNFNIEVR